MFVNTGLALVASLIAALTSSVAVTLANPVEPKVALVIGSSSGIGAATVRLLSQKGYRVAVTGTNEERVNRVAKECAELSPQKLEPLALVLDLSVPENGRVAVEKTLEHFGRLDVLINNKGIFGKTSHDASNAYENYRQMALPAPFAQFNKPIESSDSLGRQRKRTLE